MSGWRTLFDLGAHSAEVSAVSRPAPLQATLTSPTRRGLRLKLPLQSRNGDPAWSFAFSLPCSLLRYLSGHISISLCPSASSNFFKNAGDEDSYALYPYGVGAPRLDRWLSGTILSTLHWLANSYGAVLILSDALLPVLTALCAYGLAASLLKTNSARILLMIGLVFGQDLLSLGNIAVFYPTGLSPEWLRGLFGAYGATLVPIYDTSSLVIFRTPEPQTSYAVFFVVLALLIRILQDQRDASTGKLMVALAIANAFLLIIYVPLSVPVLLVQAIVSGLLWANGRKRTGGAMAAMTALIATVMAIAMSSRSGFVGTLVIPSRLPIVTPSVILEITGMLAWVTFYIKRPSSDPMLLLSLFLMALPVALANQQILTNRMISATQWEWYANYPLLILGAANLMKCSLATRQLSAPHSRRSLVRWVFIVCSLIIVVMAQARSYYMWEPLNLQSLAI